MGEKNDEPFDVSILHAFFFFISAMLLFFFFIGMYMMGYISVCIRLNNWSFNLLMKFFS